MRVPGESEDGMTAELFHQITTCGSCNDLIPAHVPVYLVTAMKLRRCERCARSMARELPKPAPLRELPKGRPWTPATFDRAAVAATVRANILDWRAKQAGE